VPITLVVASRSRRLVAHAIPGLLVLALVWTVSRSALTGVVLGALATVVLSRVDGRVLGLTLLGAVIAGIVTLNAPSLQAPFDAASPDSAASRVRRWVAITAEVEERPLIGLGLAGPRAAGIRGTDTSYVLLYAMIGVVGITAFAVLVVTTILTVGRGLRGPPRDDRALVAAAIAGLLAGVVGTAFFDHFTVAGSSRLFWLIAAIGIAAAERAPVAIVDPAPPLQWRHALGRATLPVAGGAVGALVMLAVPSHTASTAAFDVLSVRAAQGVSEDPTMIGRFLINTTCAVVNGVDHSDDVVVECREPRRAATIGELRVEGRREDDVDRATVAILRAVREAQPAVRVFPITRLESGKPTWAATAPVWGAIAGAAAALLFPRVRWRPRAVVVSRPRLSARAG
jgi:hypothetical protein